MPAKLGPKVLPYGKITYALIERLTEYYRQGIINFGVAARHVGCNGRTARKAFLEGWPSRGFRPIKDVLEEEQVAARAKLQAEHDRRRKEEADEREAAKKQSIMSRAQEGQVVQLTRTASLQAAAAIRQLTTGVFKLSDRVRQQLEAEAALPTGSPKENLILLALSARILNGINKAAFVSMQMERLHLGEPTDIIRSINAHDSVETDDMTAQEAEVRIRAATQAWRSYRRSDIPVFEGGIGNMQVDDDGGIIVPANLANSDYQGEPISPSDEEEEQAAEEDAALASIGKTAP